MISYEVAMGLSLVAVLMYSGHLSLSEIVAAQDRVWNVVPMFPAFVVYLICGIAETNRPPFDLAEAETELVAGSTPSTRASRSRCSSSASTSRP